MKNMGLAALVKSMGLKREAFIFATLFCLFIVSCSFSVYAAGPDGFANIPWGATKLQVDQAMARQGFRPDPRNLCSPGITCAAYHGNLAGTPGYLEFSFLNDAFYSGRFMIQVSDGGGTVQRACSKFLPIIQAKYGSPTQTGNRQGMTEFQWDGLQPPGSPDAVQIYVSCDPESERCGGQYCTSVFTIMYKNTGLQQHLAGQDRNGL